MSTTLTQGGIRAVIEEMGYTVEAETGGSLRAVRDRGKTVLVATYAGGLSGWCVLVRHPGGVWHEHARTGGDLRAKLPEAAPALIKRAG